MGILSKKGLTRLLTPFDEEFQEASLGVRARSGSDTEGAARECSDSKGDKSKSFSGFDILTDLSSQNRKHVHPGWGPSP